MKIAIYTQISENYGAHEWGGVGECPQYWKCKGGEVYVVPNLSAEQVLRIRDTGIPTIKSLIEVHNESFEEYVVDWSILDDDAMVCEPWETPTDLFWTNGRWVAMRTTMNDEYGYMRSDVASKTEEYELLMGGERSNYKVVYTMTNGDIVSGEDVEAYLNKAA